MAMNQPPSRPPSGGQNGGRITDQVQTTEVNAQGQVVRGYRISFTTGRGAQGSVFVAEAQYVPANVIAAVTDAANRLDQVHGATF